MYFKSTSCYDIICDIMIFYDCDITIMWYHSLTMISHFKLWYRMWCHICISCDVGAYQIWCHVWYSSVISQLCDIIAKILWYHTWTLLVPFLYCLVPSCTVLVQPCTFLYCLVPSCTVLVQSSTYWYISVHTYMWITYDCTNWYVLVCTKTPILVRR